MKSFVTLVVVVHLGVMSYNCVVHVYDNFVVNVYDNFIVQLYAKVTNDWWLIDANPSMLGIFKKTREIQKAKDFIVHVYNNFAVHMYDKVVVHLNVLYII